MNVATHFATLQILTSVSLIACGGGARGVDDGGNDPASDGRVDGVLADGPHPFGSHGGYVSDGVVFPDHPQAALDAAAASFYDTWKARYLEPACTAGQYRIKTAGSTGAYTVSEGHGYGMIAVVIMDGHDPDAHAELDGLFRYYDDHPSDGNPALMAWAQDAGCNDVDGAQSATDGDLDIAYALLLADRQWGSDGAIDYRAEAGEIIAAILDAEVHPANSILLGDWVGDGEPQYTGTRPSDFMPGHFRAFGAATAVARWGDVLERTYALIAALQDGHAAATGLLPDFATGATGASPAPAPAGWLEGANDGAYAYNACRTPWRISTDYLMSGEPRARAVMRRLNVWIRGATGDDPAEIRAGYRLDGTPYVDYGDPAFTAPFAVAAMIEPATGSNRAWLTALWDDLVATGADNYYADSIKLFALLTASGNWWSP